MVDSTEYVSTKNGAIAEIFVDNAPINRSWLSLVIENVLRDAIRTWAAVEGVSPITLARTMLYEGVHKRQQAQVEPPVE